LELQAKLGAQRARCAAIEAELVSLQLAGVVGAGVGASGLPGCGGAGGEAAMRQAVQAASTFKQRYLEHKAGRLARCPECCPLPWVQLHAALLCRSTQLRAGRHQLPH
jgi:hypothetical protein